MEELMAQASKFLDPYRQWDFLWKEKVETSFKEFLETGSELKDIYFKEVQALYANIDDQEERDAKMKESMDRFGFLQKKIFVGVTTQQPDLSHFDKKIEYLHSVKNSIDQMNLSN